MTVSEFVNRNPDCNVDEIIDNTGQNRSDVVSMLDNLEKQGVVEATTPLDKNNKQTGPVTYTAVSPKK